MGSIEEEKNAKTISWHGHFKWQVYLQSKDTPSYEYTDIIRQHANIFPYFWGFHKNKRYNEVLAQITDINTEISSVLYVGISSDHRQIQKFLDIYGKR